MPHPGYIKIGATLARVLPGARMLGKVRMTIRTTARCGGGSRGIEHVPGESDDARNEVVMTRTVQSLFVGKR
jgi:hypothetical protein